MRVIRSLVIAFSTYSRIPMPQVEWNDENRKYAMCFFPLIGCMIGLLMALWLVACSALSIGPVLKGAVCALIPLFVSGGIHMDGMMDTADALASWQPKEKRLEILKDTHTGAFAVIGCAAYLLAFAAIYSEASVESALLLATCFVLSRALSAVSLAFLNSARPGGMMDHFARAAHQRLVAVSAGVYAVVCIAAWLTAGAGMAIICAVAAALCFVYYRHMAYQKFGGVTGDLAGWFVQMVEIVLSAAIVLGGKIL